MREQSKGISAETVTLADALAVAVLNGAADASDIAEAYRSSRVQDNSDAYLAASPSEPEGTK